MIGEAAAAAEVEEEVEVKVVKVGGCLSVAEVRPRVGSITSFQ